MEILLIIYYLLLLLLFIRNLKWGIFWIVATLPVYLIRFNMGPLPLTLLEGEILLLFLVWLIKLIKHKNTKAQKHILKDKNDLLLYHSITLFLVAATISIFVAPDLRAAGGVWKAYFVEPILFLMIFVTTLKKGDIKKIFLAFSASIFLLSLLAIYQKITGDLISNPFWAEAVTRRVTSVFPYPNALALYLTPVVILLIGYLIYNLRQVTNDKRQKIIVNCWLLVVNCATLVTIYCTKSKGGLLAVLAGIIFYAIFYKGYRKIFANFLVIILIFLSFYIFINGWPNFQGAATVAGGDSVSTRLEMWQETWQMLKTRPILGAGFSGYQTTVAPWHTRDYIEIYLYPHNIVLNFWSEIGLLGLLAFILIIVWFYKKGFEDLRFKNYDLRIIIMAAMTTLLVHGLVDVPYFKNDLSVLFWVLVGSLFVILKESRDSRETTEESLKVS